MHSEASPAFGLGESVYLRLIGRPVVSAGPDEHPLSAERRHQLLAYLACRDEWVPRAEIADLFWGDHEDAMARRNLRRLLHDVRRLPFAATLQCQGDALRWQVASDLARFDRACSRGDWEESIRLGTGTLLSGIEKGATDSYHAWLRCERQAQLTRWRESLARRSQQLRGNAEARVDLARFALQHDPCNEAMLAELLEALRMVGRDAEARQAEREFTARMKEELGVEPNLVVHEQAATDRATTRTIARAGGLIGRRLEQMQMVEALRRPECRRATIIGPGGVGKSSLASSARVLLAGDFPEGVRWVALRDLVNGSQLPGRIAEACGFKGALAGDGVAALAGRIGGARLLLILDNCEHLDSVARIGEALVERCPNLKILHASRVRVGGAEEWMLPLAGLAIPDAEESEPEVLRTFDAVNLFETRARQASPTFDATRALADVVALVRMVEGLPLAIEMAAACMRLLPLPEIVRDLSRLLDVNASTTPGTRGTDSSLRASFEQSWRLLQESEKRTLERLSVFNGSFSLAAAEGVASTTLGGVAGLVDKSLVATAGEGRFAMHPLIRQFARGQLDDERAARASHAAHFADVLVARSNPTCKHDIPWSHEDASHCLEAWRWAADTGDLDLMLRMALPLVCLFNRYLRWREGIETILATLAALKGRCNRTERLRAELRYGLALCRFYNGEMAAAEEAARQSLRLCHALRITEKIPAANLYIVGSSLAWRGESARARRYFEQGLAIARPKGEAESIAKALYGIAFLEQSAGNWDLALGLYAEVERLACDRAMHQWHALALNGTGAVALSQGRLREALGCFEQGIRVCTEHEVHGRRSFLLSNRGLALLYEGDFEQAARSIDRALREARDWGIWTATVDAHLARCALEMACGDLQRAREDLRSAMQIAGAGDSTIRRLPVIRCWGQWLVASGQRERGTAVLEFVRTHPAVPRRERDAAADALAGAERGSSPAKVDRRRARSLTIEILSSEIQGGA